MNNLSGARILIVEDEYYLADDLADTLKNCGAELIGPFGTLAEAEQAVAAGGFDLAVVDMNLRGDMAFSVGDRLIELSIPFVIATGYDGAALPTRFAEVPRVEKPYEPPQIALELKRLFISKPVT